jgi:hypothetical protein
MGPALANLISISIYNIVRITFCGKIQVVSLYHTIGLYCVVSGRCFAFVISLYKCMICGFVIRYGVHSLWRTVDIFQAIT